MKFTDRLSSAWSVFKTGYKPEGVGYGSSIPQQGAHRGRLYAKNSIAGPVFNRIALDVSGVDIRHVKLDESTGHENPFPSELQSRLDFSANIDQSGKAFIQDVVYTMLEEGHAAIIPVDTTEDIISTSGYDILSWRVATVREWLPKSVRVNVYDDTTGLYQDILLPKTDVAIIQNPLYAALNDNTGTLQRLIRKLSQLDTIDEDIANGKLRLILQLPFAVKGETRRKQAEDRIHEFEEQIAKGRYGIAYSDNTEHITQLNQEVQNGILDEIKALTAEFYNQMGLSESVFNGTAKEDELRIYYSRTVDPVVQAIVDELNRKFISVTARSQGQKLVAHRDPFKLVPVDKVATIADTFKRNAILSTNEIRRIIGYEPTSDEGADDLVNPNIAAKNQDVAGSSTSVAAEGNPSALETDKSDGQSQ